MSNLCVCDHNRGTRSIATTACYWVESLREPIITRRGDFTGASARGDIFFDFTGTSAPATDSCIRPRSSGTVRVHDARFQASGRTTTVTGAGGAPRVDPRGLEDDGAGAGASSCVVPPSFRRM